MFGYSYTDDVPNGGDLIAIQNRNDAAHPFFTDIKTKHHGFDIDYKHNFDPDHLFHSKAVSMILTKGPGSYHLFFMAFGIMYTLEAYYSIHHHLTSMDPGILQIMCAMISMKKWVWRFIRFTIIPPGFWSVFIQRTWSNQPRSWISIDHHNPVWMVCLPSVICSSTVVNLFPSGSMAVPGYKSPELSIGWNEYYSK